MNELSFDIGPTLDSRASDKEKHVFWKRIIHLK
jgi:hypothetical protein